MIAGVATAPPRSAAESIRTLRIADRLANRADGKIFRTDFLGFRLISQAISFKAGTGTRRNAHAERFTRNFAIGFANVLLCLVTTQLESFVACAYARCSASSIETSLLADRLADIL